MKAFQIATVILCGLLIVVPSVWARQIFFDNFSDGDASDWQVINNLQTYHPNLPCMFGDQPAQWHVKDGYFGIDIDGPTCATTIIAQQLDLAHIFDFTVEFDWLMPESMHMDRTFGHVWKDDRNWYDFRLLDNHLLMQKFVDGKVYYMPGNSAYYNFAPYHTYHFKITVLLNRSVSVEINGQSVFQITDIPPYISGIKTIALEAGVGAISRSISYFTNISVNVLDDDTHLNAPLFKQTDPAWKGQEYDTGSQWSDNGSIQRWGCALSSMAMIMRYYGMATLPTGEDLNPGTLNTWLKSQADGYLLGGGLNWNAVTRLTRLLNQVLDTPKLEYSRAAGNLQSAKSEIAQNRPVILEILGHFLVGDGTQSTPDDLYIKDPAYKYTLFSQHKTPLLSVRKFQPSHTDLSYFVFTHAPQLKTTLKDSTGQVVAGLDITDDTITDPVDQSGESTPFMIHELLPKPATGTYTLEVSQPNPGSYTLQLITYDQDANPTILTQTGVVGPEPTQIVIQYQKTGSTRIQQLMNFTQLRHDLKVLYTLKQVTSTQTYLKLDQTAAYAEQATVTQQLRYIDLLNTQITQLSLSIKPDAQTQLRADLNQVKSLLTTPP